MTSIPNERCAVYAMKAITTVKIKDKKSSSSSISSSIVPYPYNNIGIVELLNMIIKQGKVSVALVVVALSSCRDLDDWQSVLQIYNMAKLATKGGIMVDNTKHDTTTSSSTSTSSSKESMVQIIDKLPSIVYG